MPEGVDYVHTQKFLKLLTLLEETELSAWPGIILENTHFFSTQLVISTAHPDSAQSLVKLLLSKVKLGECLEILVGKLILVKITDSGYETQVSVKPVVMASLSRNQTNSVTDDTVFRIQSTTYNSAAEMVLKQVFVLMCKSMSDDNPLTFNLSHVDTNSLPGAEAVTANES